MKNIILGTVAVVAMANCSFGQGEIQFFNSSAAASKIETNGLPGQPSTGQDGALMPGNATATYMFALFVGTSTNSATAVAGNESASTTPWASAGWAFSNDYATNSALGGRIVGVDGGLGFETVSGLGVGADANVELIGWNTAVGGTSLSSFETAYAEDLTGLFYGYSGVANVELGDNGATVANSSPFGATANGLIGGFTLAPVVVPEPGTMVLAGLGGLSLLAFRRKK